MRAESNGRFLLLGYSTDAATAQTALSALPEQYSEETLDLLHDHIAVSVSRFLTELHFALGGRYDVRYCMLSVALEKVPKAGSENETSGVR